MLHLFFLFCSLAAALPGEERREPGDVKMLVNNLKETIARLNQGVNTSDLSKAIAYIIGLIDDIIAGPGAHADKSQVEDVISATSKTIKNHDKTGKLSTKLWELSRAITLFTDLTNQFTSLADDDEKVYQAAAAIKATGQAILDSLQVLGEDHISYDPSQKEKFLESKERIKRTCDGCSVLGVCVGYDHGR